MEEWKEYKLGDICTKIGSGATPKGGKEAYLGGNISLIRSQNVLDFTFSEDGLANINDEQANKLKNVEVKENDVLLNITGDSVARACIVPNTILPARVNQHVAIIRGDNSVVLNEFILYALQYKKQYLLSISQGGGTRNALTKKMIEDFMINLPSLPTQQKIANILSSLDDKIEVNRRINEQLEELAGALFKSWFVDFEPFKDGEFVDSELGMIPKGWKVVEIQDFGNIICGKTPSKDNKDYYGGDIPFIKIPDMHNNIFVKHTEDWLSEEGNLSQIKKRIPPYSICVSCIATVGLVIMNTTYAHTNQQINTIIPNNEYERYYLFEQLKSMKEYIQNLGRGGTATLNVNTKTFSKIKVLRPFDTILENYDSIVSGIFEKIELNQQEIHHLTTLRDTLLPKLMSGEIDVNEVEI